MAIVLGSNPSIESTELTQNDIGEVNTASTGRKVSLESSTNEEASSGTTDHLSIYLRKRRAGFLDVETSRDVKKLKGSIVTPDAASIAGLRQKGAFDLPSRQTRDELVDAFFQWVAPLVPVVRKSKFLRDYQDPDDSPSLLLLQAILAAGSTVCKSPCQGPDQEPCAYDPGIYFDRARLLYEANHEKDPVTQVQSLILMGWYWEGLNGMSRKARG